MAIARSKTALLCALALAAWPLACARCHGTDEQLPPSQHLPRIPDGYGEPVARMPVLELRERQLLLPSGSVCLAADPACAVELGKLRGRPIGLELDRGLLMADLSDALALLPLALERDDQACLIVGDARSTRCLPFRPMSGEELGAWLDAPKPLGKIRLVMRSDGIEVVADRGKVPGPDRFGPTLPPVRGKPDFERLDPLMRQMAARFPDEEQAAVVPSGRMSVEDAARALAALNGPDGSRFSQLFLVYP